MILYGKTVLRTTHSWEVVLLFLMCIAFSSRQRSAQGQNLEQLFTFGGLKLGSSFTPGWLAGSIERSHC